MDTLCITVQLLTQQDMLFLYIYIFLLIVFCHCHLVCALEASVTKSHFVLSASILLFSF